MTGSIAIAILRQCASLASVQMPNFATPTKQLTDTSQASKRCSSHSACQQIDGSEHHTCAGPAMAGALKADTASLAALFNPGTSVFIQNSHPFTGNLNSGTSGDSNSMFLHRRDVLAVHKDQMQSAMQSLCIMPCMQAAEI